MPLTPETLGLIESTVYLCLMTEKTISVSALFCKMQEFESLIQNRKNIFFVFLSQSETLIRSSRSGLFLFCFILFLRIRGEWKQPQENGAVHFRIRRKAVRQNVKRQFFACCQER